MIKNPLRIFFPFILAVGMMAGCRKEIHLPDSAGIGPGIVGDAKNWFERNRSESNGGELDFGTLHPDWKNYRIDRNNAGQPVLTVPVANRSKQGHEYMELAYAVGDRGEVGVVKHYIGDLNGGQSVGLKFYDARGRLFVQGRYDAKTGMFSPVAPLAVSRKGKLNKIASMSASGNSYSEEPVSNPDNPIVIDEVVVYPPGNGCSYCGSWPPPGTGGGGDGGNGGGGSGGGNGNGGGGGTGVPAPPGGGWNGGGVPNQQPKLTINPSKDPCGGRAAVNQRLNLGFIKNRNSEMFGLSTQNEHAYEIIMNNLSTKSIEINEIREGEATEVQYGMNWTNNSVTVGFNHTHPFESAPSHRDLFVGVVGYDMLQLSELKSTFVDYYTSTIITPSYTYVVTIKDVAKWTAYGTDFETKMNNDKGLYEEYSTGYDINNPGVLWSEAQEYALLTLYDDIVNIYRAPRTNTSDFKPLELQNGKPGHKGCN